MIGVAWLALSTSDLDLDLDRLAGHQLNYITAFYLNC